MRLMKKGKAVGYDGIPIEVLEKAGPEAFETLKNMCNEFYRLEKIPEDWQKGIICPIWKKGDNTICGNYSRITLLSHASKIYSRILEKRVRGYVENMLGEWQHGFRPGRSTVDLIFTVKMILEKSWEWGIEKFALFIDMEKAFDRVPRQKMWQILSNERYKVPAKLVRVIRNTYSQCLSKVRGRNLESDLFSIDTGVRQGDILSPLLFVIYMDSCFRDVGVGGHGEETLAYADDVAVVTDSVIALQEIVNKWHSGMTRNGMKINTACGKTEFIAVGRRDEQYDIMMEQEKIGQVAHYKYLGANINNRNIQEVEINERIAKYNRNVAILYPLLRDMFVPRECKVTIFNTILKPVIMYGSEAWSLTTKTESKLQAAEMRVLRLIRGVTRRDHTERPYGKNWKSNHF